ncbi:hypothetical protein [Absidia glauca]|uniref:Cyclin n=1 Tax=Absidia glauca TaxID=4829 RepID=A0A163K2J2_ABSGL|nr:hypothetical protein [Absidia glauca]
MTFQQANHYDLASHPAKDTIRLISFLLEKVISVNDTIFSTCNDISPDLTVSLASLDRSSFRNTYTCFHARSIPTISIQAYLIRILKYCPCTNECFLAILVYFDRMAKSAPPARPEPLRIDSFNIHRLIISGVMIASKLFSDVFYTNARYAKVGGLTVSELNTLEIEFLALNEYKLFVTIEEFQYYGDQLLLHWLKENGTANTTPREIRDHTSPSTPSVFVDGPTHKHKKWPMTRTKHTGIPSPEKYQEKDHQPSQQLALDKSSTGTNITCSHSTPTMKDTHRKSDEIDSHRLFKRSNSMHDRGFETSTECHSSSAPCTNRLSTTSLITPPSTSPLDRNL